eukprot:gene30599-34732_t
MCFRDAPPTTGLDTATDDRPNPPFRDAPVECRSVYYYWWAFLRENEGYMACCERGGQGEFAELFESFGDIRDDAFFTWWRKGGRHLFCEPEIGSPAVHLSPPRLIDHDNEVLVTIPITGDIDRTLAELRTLLRKAMRERREELERQGQKDIQGAKYPVHTMPVLTSLHQTLTIWQAKKRLPEGATLVEIGREAELASTKAYGGRDAASNALAATTVSRCLKAAGRLIENVGQGRFPDTSDPMSTKESDNEDRVKPKKVKRE